MREKHNTIQELQKKNQELVGKKRLALVGQGDFQGGNNVMRATMNSKHNTQHLAIDNPEFPFFYDGKENVSGKYSSFYQQAPEDMEVIAICKKYNERLKGKVNIALYFMYAPGSDSYYIFERNEVENLTENFGFEYNNDYLDQCSVGDKVPKDTVLSASTSYDAYMNVSRGVNGRILYAVHPAVQDDAIIVSESFAKRMVTNLVSVKAIPINENTLLLNLYGKDGEYQGLPNIGDVIHNGILAATRTVKETRMFSDLRDASLQNINHQSDTVFYCDGESEVVDINVYCNNPNLKLNKVTRQLLTYYNDARWFYTEVYKVCKMIIHSGAKYIDPEINHWMRRAMNYLDTQALWAFNDNIFKNLMVEVLVRKKEPIKLGRKIVGRHGNKTVSCSVWPDEEMPYLTRQIKRDEYGVAHPVGTVERVELITNPLAVINRTIPIAMIEGSITFILDLTRKHAATLPTREEKKEFIFDILRMLNPEQSAKFEAIYEKLSEYEKDKYIEDCISLNPDGTLKTNNGLYCEYKSFNSDWSIRDAIISVYQKYPDIFKPYHIFVPKPKWGRDIYIGDDCVGYQYIMMLKQSGEKGFSVRSAGAISDESLPEKSHDSKVGKLWHSEKPIKILLAINRINCGNALIA